MPAKPTTLSVENLEFRLNLSTLGAGPAPAPTAGDFVPRTQEVAILHETRAVQSLAHLHDPASKTTARRRKPKPRH